MTKSRDIWIEEEWQTRRQQCASYERWYDGKPLDKTEPRSDGDGRDVKTFPLRLNTVALACDVHKDYTRGGLGIDPLFVKAVMVRKKDDDRADFLETLVNDLVWRASYGGVIMSEAILAMNIFGATVFKISFEPWDTDLPTGFAVRSIKNPSLIKPTWDFLNPNRMLECYFGYEIDPNTARLKYGVEPKGSEPPLYMEHWTLDEWKITVDDRVPEMKGYGPLEGDNIYGIIPFYYVAHERGVDPWGRSQVKGAEELTLEINARTVGVSDMVRNLRSDTVWATDVRGEPIVRRVFDKGKQILKLINLGNTSGAVGSKPPALHSMPAPDIPEYYARWPSILISLWEQFFRLSPVTFGQDDTKSGRITGPAVAQRAWTSTSHADTERLSMTTAKTQLDMDLIRIFAKPKVREMMEKVDKKVQDVQEDDSKYVVLQLWPQILPLDDIEDHKQRIDKLREAGMSPERFLEEDGVVDVAGEKQRIVEWQEEKAEIAAKANPNPMFGAQGGNTPS